MVKKVNTKSSKSRSNLDAVVREKLREAILNGEMPNGAHLSEIKISEQFGVSRTPVREALCALAADGLVEMFPNRGAFAKSPTGEVKRELADMYTFLMGLAGRISAEKIAETDVARIERLVNSLSTLSADDFEDTRWQINDLIRNICGSSVVNEMLRTVENRMPRPVMPLVANSHMRSEIQHGYTYLVTALKRRKNDVAEKAARDVMQLNMGTMPLAQVGAA